jgi:NADH:ubiquinone oxidoreductase subunit C
VKNSKQLSLLISQKKILYTSLHIRTGSFFFKTQLVDIFAYELPTFSFRKSSIKTKVEKVSMSVVYNFHNLLNQTRYYIFSISSKSFIAKKFLSQNFYLNSITELFNTASWLEREIAELQGIGFLGKKDLRNLMLQYGDTSAPFRKSIPSTGFREIFYDSISDYLVQRGLSFQG